MAEEMPSDLDEGADWGKGVPMKRGEPTRYEAVDQQEADPAIDVTVVSQPQYRRTRSGQILSFDGEFKFGGELQRAEMTVWEEKIDLVPENLAQGDVLMGLLKNAKMFRGKQQFTLEPTGQAPVAGGQQPGQETRGREERPESPRNVGEEYEIRYETAPISFRTPVNYQQMAKIVHRSFSDAYREVSGVVEADMVAKGVPMSEFPFSAVIAAAQAGGATISIACTNGLVTISRERKTRRQDREPSLEAREIADQARRISERVAKRNMMPDEGEESGYGE